jgi:CBS domain-containing protein
MNEAAFQFLMELPLFTEIPEEEIKRLSEKIHSKEYPEGETAFLQGESVIDEVLIVNRGLLEIYYDRENEKILSGFLTKGELFGGISLLMNAGISIRTVKAKEFSSCYLIPKEEFLNICARFKSVHEYFVNEFNRRMLDLSYASMIITGQTRLFLSRFFPFSFLPEEEMGALSEKVSVVHYPKETLLFVQGRSRVDHLYVIKKGSTERYYEENGKQILHGVLEEGGVFGGISMLVNDGISIRSLKIKEDTDFYTISKKDFMDLCVRYPAFTEYFTDTFGKRMMDRTYAAIIKKPVDSDEEPNFFNEPVSSYASSNLAFCSWDVSIQQAASIMTERKCSSIFIQATNGEFVGIVTDNDFRKKAIAQGLAIHRSVSDIMSSPLTSVPANSLVFEALMAMMEKNVKHLALTDGEGKVVGVVTNRDLLNAQSHSPLLLIREINTAGNIYEIKDKHARLPRLIKNLISGGAKSGIVNRLITTISDAILKKIIEFALQEIGPPPCRFAFMVMGSEGRKEQTLKTDQDNAIVFEDISGPLKSKVTGYFLGLGDKVCTWLDEAGYAFCEGGIMAKNPKWCSPISVWKEYFKSWVDAVEPEDLLRSSIFFDFRFGYGDAELIGELKKHLFDYLEDWSGFFRYLTENALHIRPPIGFFRSFVVESKGEHRDTFDIKNAMLPIVDFARIYALRYKIMETNTHERLQRLFDQQILSWSDFTELDQAYSFMMQLRFVRQINAVIEENRKPDNHINPKKLSHIEQTMLKEIFKRIEKFQTKLSLDFTGIT